MREIIILRQALAPRLSPSESSSSPPSSRSLSSALIGRLVTCRLRQASLARGLVPIYRSADTQILLSRAKNLGFLAENLGEILFKDACRYFELIAGAARP